MENERFFVSRRFTQNFTLTHAEKDKQANIYLRKSAVLSAKICEKCFFFMQKY